MHGGIVRQYRDQLDTGVLSMWSKIWQHSLECSPAPGLGPDRIRVSVEQSIREGA